MAEATLKAKNLPQVIVFITWCVVLFLAFKTGPAKFWHHVQSWFTELRLEDGLFAAMAPIIALVANGLLSARLKTILVFWRRRHALPGHRAFSVWAHRDRRFTVEQLTRKMGALPEAPEEQNAAWYRLFKRYESVNTVVELHRQYLLARDLAAISLLLAGLGGPALLILGQDPLWVLLFFGVMLGHYLLLAIVARNKADAMVCEVLARHCLAPAPITGSAGRGSSPPG